MADESVGLEGFDVLPEPGWDDIQAEKVQVSVTLIDAFGLPIQRRGVTVGVPRPHEVENFACEAGRLVEKTMKVVFA